MPILIDCSQVIQDDWIRLDNNRAPGNLKKIIVTHDRLKNDWLQLRQISTEIGVELMVDAEVEEFAFCLADLKLILLPFASFADGRAFSQARLLRDRFGYEGDIRAIGEVVLDQLEFMRRCGFNQFELSEGADACQALQVFNEISIGYQLDMARKVNS